MTYAVHHVDAEGCGQLEDTGSLEDALARVEVLRNDGAVSEVRVLKEVPIEVRTYYRVVAVEGDGAAGDGQGVPRAVPDAAVQPPVDAPTMDPSPMDMLDIERAVEPVAEEVPDPVPAQEPERAAPVFGEPPSGAVVMGPPPAVAPPEAAEAPADPAPEPRRALFGRG